MALSLFPDAVRVRTDAHPAYEAALSDVRGQLDREFRDVPPDSRSAVFEACLASLDTTMQQARPELVYRLARERMINIVAGRNDSGVL